MFKTFINNIKIFLYEWTKLEKALLEIRCLVSDPNTLIQTEIFKFPIKRQRYAMWKAYRWALWGYPLENIINELNFIRRNIV